MNSIIELNKHSNAIKYLKSSDSYISELIDLIGNYKLILDCNYFSSLVRLIIGQQLSNKVAAVIYNRLIQTVKNNITPEILININDNKLRELGISKSKISFIKNLSNQILLGNINLLNLSKLDNTSDIYKKLLNVKGIGPWTADMFLIFSLGKMNVMSYNDIGLKRSIKWLYQLNDYPDDRFIKNLSKKWDPYETVSSLYLWEIINQNFIKYPNIETAFLMK